MSAWRGFQTSMLHWKGRQIWVHLGEVLMLHRAKPSEWIASHAEVSLHLKEP